MAPEVVLLTKIAGNERKRHWWEKSSKTICEKTGDSTCRGGRGGAGGGGGVSDGGGVISTSGLSCTIVLRCNWVNISTKQ